MKPVELIDVMGPVLDVSKYSFLKDYTFRKEKNASKNLINYI